MGRPGAGHTPQLVYRHTVPVRIWHWLTVAAVMGLLFTGFNVVNVHPRLYWGEVGNAATPPAIALISTEPGGPKATTHPAPAALVVGSHTWDVTGWLGAAWDLGADGMYFVIAITPDSWHFGAMRAWHFAWAWLLVLTWLAFLAYLVSSGRMWRVLMPTSEQRTARALIRDILDHLRLRRWSGASAQHYNLLQKLSYLFVLLVLIPAAILSGLTMSNAVTARFPELYTLFGGRQSARTVHALCAAAVVVFALVHFFQLFVAGFFNEIRSMLTGYFEIHREKGA